MVGDFMVCVDKIIAPAACFEGANDGSPVGDGRTTAAAAAAEGCSMSRMANAERRTIKGGEIVECRICQEEDDEFDMEAPCACNGSLKFAHRKCVQRWCNKKGNLTCEICNQVFSPNYFIPPVKTSAGVMAIDARQSWGSQFDLHDPHSHFFAIAAAEEEFLATDYGDYASANSRGIACSHAIALILMLLLFVRQVLNAMKEVGIVQDISSIYNLSLQFAGIFLPCYMIARSCYFIQSRRRRQGFEVEDELSHERLIKKRRALEGDWVINSIAGLVGYAWVNAM